MHPAEQAACRIFFANLKRWCREAGITIEELSEATGVPLRTLRAWTSWGIVSPKDANPLDLQAVADQFSIVDFADMWATPQTIQVMHEADPVALNRLLSALGGDRFQLYRHLNQFSATMNWQRHLNNAAYAVG